MTLDYFYGQTGELFSFYRIPKALFQEQRFQSLSTDAKTLYGILLDRMSLSAKNGWLDEQNRVFIIFTIEDVKRSLCCADNKATKLLRELEEFGLIERKRRGLGRPSLVYVKNFSADSSKTRFQNRENHESGGFKSASQDPAKPRCNKTDKNNTEMNETYPFNSEETDGMSQREQLEKYFSQSLEIELLLRLCPDDEDIIYQIVDLLVDTCATKRKMLRIAGDDRPAEVVRSRFMQQKWNQNFDGEPMTDIPQKFLNAGCDVYMVMQLRHDEKILDERFASMRELHRRGKTPDPEHYEVTYYADLPAMWQDVPNNEILEELFQMFNSRPQDFEGHSLSVSDVIALKRNGDVSVHYVDSIGFKELPGFLDKKPERTSVLQNLKEKCDAPECNPTVCRKARDAHEL